MTVTLTITAADGATTTIPMNDPVINFSPASLSPVLWNEAARGGAFQSRGGTISAVANGDVVGFLPDFSGNAKTLLSVADDSSRPTLQGVGAFPYINFDGVNDLLTCAAINSYAAGAASWFFAMRSGSALNYATLASEGNSTVTQQYYDLIQRSNSGSFAGGGINNDAGVVKGFFTFQNGVFDGADHVYGVVDTGTSVTPYLDGVAGTPLAYTRSGTLTVDNFSLGALRRSTVGFACAARVYSSVCVNRVLTSAEIAKLTTYLGAAQGRTL